MLKRTSLVALAIALLPCLAEAQASVQLRLDLPVILPPTVVISPGVRVVPDVEEEVFFVDSFYWVRHDGGWYRARSHRGGWAYVAPHAVPGRLVQVPPGRYRKWHPAQRPARGYARPAPSPWQTARGAPAPHRDRVYRDRHRDRDRDHDGDRGHDRGHGKKKGHDKHDD